MLRRISLTLVQSVVVFTLAACLTLPVASPATRSLSRTLAPASPAVPHLASRSGYIVASS